ncbi:MAG: LPS-assembly protein LptD [Neisseria sp.]|nr:LPS-assembly protein LptD [Neisseria sp.]
MACAAAAAQADETALGSTCLFCEKTQVQAVQSGADGSAADVQVQRSGEETPPEHTRITADQVEGQTDVGVRAEGDVIVERNQQVLNADWAEYDQAADTVRAGDNFVLYDNGSTVTGKTLEYKLSEGTGKAQDMRVEAEHEGRRFQAVSGEADLQAKNRYELKDVQFNTCNKGDASWYIQADSVRADYDSGIGVAKNAKLVFGGVPVLYTPWADFPLNGNRKSGFLVPTLEIGSDGTKLDVPYYLNLAPNYDATVSAGFIGRRGVRFGGEMRYLQPDYQGGLNAVYMPHDAKSEHNHRYHARWAHRHQISDGLSAGIDFNQVSDDDYYRDFYGQDDIASNVNLNRQAWLDHETELFGGRLKNRAEVQKYQTLANRNGYASAPYAILPRLSSEWQKNIGDTQLNVFGQFTRFEHKQRQEGSRFVLYPSISHRFGNDWGYLKPKVGVHYTHYRLDAFGDKQRRSLSRSLPIINLDGGITLERDTNLWQRDYVQTLEPRLFYNYIPTKSQNDLPNFDASENSFSYDQLFRENLYSGNDRINSSNSLTTAVQTRFLDKHTGAERFRAGVGQKFYFKDDNVLLDGSISQYTRSRSDWLAFADGKITDSVSGHAVLHYNESKRQMQNAEAGIVYNPEAGKTVALRYKYGRNEPIYLKNDGEYHYDKLQQISLGAQWPLSQNLYAVGRLNYGLDNKKFLHQMAGFEYKSGCGCWSATFAGHRFVNGIDQANRSTYKNGVMFTLQLKDLSSLGKSPKEQLRLAIPGYSTTNEVVNK